MQQDKVCHSVLSMRMSEVISKDTSVHHSKRQNVRYMQNQYQVEERKPFGLKTII